MCQNRVMKPVIRELDAMILVGLGTRFIAALSPDADNARVIPPLWQKFSSRREEIPGTLGFVDYGAVVMLSAAEKKRPDELFYLAGAAVDAVDELPSGMQTVDVPAGTYAVFTHRGPIATFGATVARVYREWLPATGLAVRPAPHLEVYDERFDPMAANSELGLYIPIERL